MTGRWIITGAIACYALVMGCVPWLAWRTASVSPMPKSFSCRSANTGTSVPANRG